MSTEKRNQRTENLDDMSTLSFLQVMNDEDHLVPAKIKAVLPQLATIVEQVITCFNNKGRLIYLGAGTSGRLGILDAVECVPTFSTPPEMVQGLIAGGEKAFVRAVEGAEDSLTLSKDELKKIQLSNKDMVIGIAASGRTPYVIGGLEYANKIGAVTASISCNRNAKISHHAQFPLEVDFGPEVLTGSTRLKAGSGQKMILNMISTAAMIGIGKTYGNLMVDVMPTNEKLVDRAKRIIMSATDVDYETAELYYEKTDGQAKLAIVMILTGCTKEEAEERLKDGFVSKALRG